MLLSILLWQVQGTTKHDLELLERLPHLVALDLSCSSLQDEQLAGLQGVTGLEALSLRESRITPDGLQALLPRLQLLTSLVLGRMTLGEEAFSAVGQLAGLQHLVVDSLHPSAYNGIEQLRQLQHLTSLGASGWEVSSREGWSLVCSSSLRALDVCTISAEAVGPGVCQVTGLTVHHLSDDMPLLPSLSKLEVQYRLVPHIASLMQHTALTELVVSGVDGKVGAAALRCLARPPLHVLRLAAHENSVNTTLTDATLQLGLGQWTGLECLSLRRLRQLTDQSLDWVASNLPCLRSLEVSCCSNVTREGTERAQRAVARRAAARGV